MDIINKAERALADYLAASVSGVAIRRARQGGDPVEGSLLLIHADSAQIHPDLPPDAGTYVLACSLTLLGTTGETAAPSAPLGQITCALLDIASAQAFLNGDAYDLHLHNLNITGQTAGDDDGARPSHLITISLEITNAVAA